MRKQKLYKYIGYNGVITTPINLPDIPRMELYELYPSNGYCLTDGNRQVQSVIVTEDEIDNWTEKKLGIVE